MRCAFKLLCDCSTNVLKSGIHVCIGSQDIYNTEIAGKYLMVFFCFVISLTQVLGPYVGIIIVLPWSLVQLILASEWIGDTWMKVFIRLEVLAVFVLLFTLHDIVRGQLLHMEQGKVAIPVWVLDLALMIAVFKFGIQVTQDTHLALPTN
eukprot:COSAG02_NODE_73_length_41919_cov_6.571066_34_plen_150_part_00